MWADADTEYIKHLAIVLFSSDLLLRATASGSCSLTLYLRGATAA